MEAQLFFGNSPAIAAALTACQRYAPSRAPVLILGASGVGKTRLARHLHDLSGRRGEFVQRSVALVHDNLEASALCGTSRDAFTGSVRDAQGVIEAARGGTLFLDEIGLAAPKVQEMLLALIEDRSVTRVGEVRARPVDTRFVGATNVDLHQAVRERRFRSDLLARFGYLRIRLPGLSERRDEILPLVEQCLARESAARGQVPPQLSPTLAELLVQLSWPDNIRQVESVCQHLVLYADPGRLLEPADLPDDFLTELGLTIETRRRVTGERVQQALIECGGNRAEAARHLGISLRHLYRLLAGGQAPGRSTTTG